MKFRFLNAGESHGECLSAIIEGTPANFEIDIEKINKELSRRQTGYGRGARMTIEKDRVKIKSGLRFGMTTGAPIFLEIENKDFKNWAIPMSCEKIEENELNLKLINDKRITKVRPGHADLSGAIKYNQKDIRNILERSSARETATRVAVGAIAKQVLEKFNIKITSEILSINNIPYENKNEIIEEIEKAKENGDSLGGSFKVKIENLPIGLGSFVFWDRRLDGLLAQAIMSIQAVKSVEFGMGSEVANHLGSEVQDEIFYNGKKVYRNTNNAGGIEGGMSNGEPVVIKASMKPIPTLRKSLKSIDLLTKESYNAHFERADVCAVEACAVVAEAMAAIILLDQFLQKFGGDSYLETKNNLQNYLLLEY